MVLEETVTHSDAISEWILKLSGPALLNLFPLRRMRSMSRDGAAAWYEWDANVAASGGARHTVKGQQVAGSQHGPPVPAGREEHGCQKQVRFLMLQYSGLGYKHGAEGHTRWSSRLSWKSSFGNDRQHRPGL